MIDGGGNARVLVTSEDLTQRVQSYDAPLPVPMSGPSAVSTDQFDFGVVTQSTRLELWTLSPSGALSIASIAHDAVKYGDTRNAKEYVPTILIPDDEGTVLLTWFEEWHQDINGGADIEYHSTRHFGRVPLGAGSATVLPLSDDVGLQKAAMGEQNTLFVSDGYLVSALDATSGGAKWTVLGRRCAG